MKVGVYLIEAPREAEARTAPIASPDFLRGFARTAEEVGFESIWFPDHVVMPVGYGSRYPYQDYEGEQFERYPYDTTAFPEPFTALAYVAGATDRIKLRTGVLILPERNPVLFDKQLATLDALSGGRVELGIGIGWLREEFEALGIPWRGRGRRTDECIEAMRALWTQDVASYQGETVRFEGIRCDPKPARPGGIPLIVGGHTEAAARRAGRLGDGFVPSRFEGPERADELVAVMREAARAAGRDPDALEICAGASADLEAIEAMADRGVQHVYIVVGEATLEAAQARLHDIAERVLARI